MDHSSKKAFIGDNFLLMRRNKLYEKVSRKDLVLIEGACDYVKVWTTNGTSYLLRQTMKGMEEMLKNRSFYRIHRSYIINLEAIQAVDFVSGEVTVLDRTIPINRKSRLELGQMMLKVE